MESTHCKCNHDCTGTAKKPKINPGNFKVPQKYTNETYASAAKRRLADCRNMYELARTLERILEEIKPHVENLYLLYNINQQPPLDNLKCCKYFNMGNCPSDKMLHHEDRNHQKITSHFCMICKTALSAGLKHPAINCTLLTEVDQISNLPKLKAQRHY